jgi:hypothetical protein
MPEALQCLLGRQAFCWVISVVYMCAVLADVEKLFHVLVLIRSSRSFGASSSGTVVTMQLGNAAVSTIYRG